MIITVVIIVVVIIITYIMYDYDREPRGAFIVFSIREILYFSSSSAARWQLITRIFGRKLLRGNDIVITIIIIITTTITIIYYIIYEKYLIFFFDVLHACNALLLYDYCLRRAEREPHTKRFRVRLLLFSACRSSSKGNDCRPPDDPTDKIAFVLWQCTLPDTF